MRKIFKVFMLTLLLCGGAALLIGLGSSGPAVNPANGKLIKSIRIGNGDSGMTLLSEDKNGITVRVKIGKVDLIKVRTPEGKFILPRIEGFTRSFKVGEPMLPIASKLISIPFGCKLKARVIDYTKKEVSLPLPLMPVQPSLSKSVDPASVKFEYNKEIYSTPGKYALPLAGAEVKGTMRATRLGRIAISPVEYYPTENRATIYRSVTVRIKFKNPNWKLTEKMKKKYSSFYFEPVNRQLLNYDRSDFFRTDLTKYPITYVIVADRMFEAQLQTFIQWKTKKGYKVITGYTDTIGTTTTAIKTYIQNLYNTESPAPSFVLFVGDDQQIPAWDGNAGNHITDLYYCEFTGDDLPEIYYGRFSAQNTGLLQPQIDKTLMYEQYTMPDPSYLAEVTLVSGVDSGYADPYGNGQINYGTTYYFNAAHSIAPNVWLYPASDGPTARTDIIQTVNDGVGFYNYTAHCSHTGPADPAFNQTDVANLNNYGKYLLGIGNCCLSNTFGANYSDACFGEAWLQNADKGGIGWIGGSNSTYWDEDYWWGVGYGPIVGTGPTYEETGTGAYDGAFHDHGETVNLHYTTNAAIIFAGNMAVTEAGSNLIDYYWEIYHLMGDPSVMTYMGIPANNTVSHPASLLITETSVTVQADEGSYVGVTKDGVLHGAGYVDSSGSVDIALTDLGSEGTAIVMVTCQNKIPYESSIPVTAGTVPPTADFYGTPTSGEYPLTVDFTDQSIGATSWSWNFGDTGTSTDRNPTHIYNTEGVYTVTLTATNSYGNDTMVKTDYITVTQKAPVADFTFNANLLVVTFTDQSYDTDGTIVSWDWNFGDTNSSTQQNPVHTFAAKGTYAVTLTVTDDDGATGFITKDVTVDDDLYPDTYVFDITQNISRQGNSYTSSATVTIKDSDGNLVPNATVSITWSGVVSGTDSKVTGSGGTATFTSASARKLTGPFTITVNNITHATMDYNSSLNIETSDTAYY
ncbi:MAG: PKD domain-containing protein [Candidatus Aminicenantes bacterium]|nr:PKD domain-containing protein [Candidatus Aminicenantes bacterium]